MCPRSIAGVKIDLVGSLQITLLLRTTCMRSCCNWSASCLAALQTKKQKPDQGSFVGPLLGKRFSCSNLVRIITITRIPKFTINIQIHHFKITFMCPRSVAKVRFDSVGSLQTTLLLRTTCMRSCCIGVLVVCRHYKPKNKSQIRAALWGLF